MKWYLRACPIDQGDLHEHIEDRGWVTCFKCGRSFSLEDPRLQHLRKETPAEESRQGEPHPRD